MPPSNHLLTSITKHSKAWTPCSFLLSPSAGDRTVFGRNHQVALYYSESPVKKTDNPLGMLKVFDLLSAKKLEEWGGRSGRTPKESPEEAAPTMPLDLQPPFNQGQWKVTPAKRAETVAGTQSIHCTNKEGEKNEGEGSQGLLSSPPHWCSGTSQLAGPCKESCPVQLALAWRP